jgi:2-polyprenyl-6-methoxyphenol hydroxylase-like FAD-dependent oxidoreductase
VSAWPASSAPTCSARSSGSGPYAYRSQCLDQMRIGSVFFMGDTAKIVSPFGARGGNTGVADADNLAWKLAAVLRGRPPGAAGQLPRGAP